MQTNRYQEVKRKIRQHYEERLFNQSQKIKELEKEKSDLVTMLIQLNQKSEKDKKRIEYFKRKWQESETQKMQAAGGFGFGFQTPQYQPMFQFPTSGGGQGQQQRYSFMGAQMHPISSTNTPTTSAMDTTNGGGAGEYVGLIRGLIASGSRVYHSSIFTNSQLEKSTASPSPKTIFVARPKSLH